MNVSHECIDVNEACKSFLLKSQHALVDAENKAGIVSDGPELQPEGPDTNRCQGKREVSYIKLICSYSVLIKVVNVMALL